jgi:hypothetical protein
MAQRSRDQAAGIKNALAKENLLEVAKQYDLLAEAAEAKGT